MNRDSFDSGLGSSQTSSLNSTSSYQCPVWSWKVDRIWNLQKKLEIEVSKQANHDTQQSFDTTSSNGEVNFFLESLKFGADLQSNFLTIRPLRKVPTRARAVVTSDCVEAKKDIISNQGSIYKFDHGTRNSSYVTSS